MRFSVVIPCYNSQATIERALHSCLNQSFADFEVIVVNNGSTDNTSLILQRFEPLFKERGIHYEVVVFDANQGPSGSRNKGWELARGEYVAFLDHDDFWRSQKLEVVDRVLKSDPSIDCLAHGFAMADRADNQELSLNQSMTVKPIGLCQLLFKNFAVTPAVVVRASVQDRFDETMQFCEDHDLWLRLSKKHKIFYLDQPLVLIGRPVLSKGGQSGHRWEMRKGEIYMYSKFCNENFVYIWSWPFWIVYSLLKHIRSLLIR